MTGPLRHLDRHPDIDPHADVERDRATSSPSTAAEDTNRGAGRPPVSRPTQSYAVSRSDTVTWSTQKGYP